MSHSLLRIDSSGRHEGSHSRRLADRLTAGLETALSAKTIVRDLTSDVPPVVDDAWVAGAYKPDAERSDAERAALAPSDAIVDEFMAANALVITAPIYNFTVPAQLKLWIDQVARFGRTFSYGEAGPVALTPDRPTYLILTSGGTEVDGPYDFATPYLRHVLAFVGLKTVHIVDAGALMRGEAEGLARAEAQIDALVAQAAPPAAA